MPTSVGTEPASHAALTRVTVFFIRLCLRVVWGLVLGMVFAFVYILCGTSSAVRLVTPVEDMKAHWVVVVGKKPGIYSNSLIASSQTVGVKGAIMKRCSSRAQAERHYQEAINLIRAVPDPATAPPFDNDGDTTGCEDDGDLYANSPEVLGAVALPAVALDPALAPTDLIEHAVGSGSEDNPRSSGNFRPSYTPSETIDFASTTAVSTSASQSMVINV
ncbi:hypothetical protein BD410DRAFT_166216 [Rickenella mellea]|uniref:Ribonuclease H1 N-terminal domain-containing protein n=1 Tax=Rickenella mellea TaxID=50990 RepID=A0A4Y7PIL4_9AGAM|nr:hypothetical protein BD410DRAFT_166216 [Rickenella mellea]